MRAPPRKTREHFGAIPPAAISLILLLARTTQGLASPPATVAHPLAAFSVAAEIEKSGAKQTIARLVSEGQWDAVVDRIGSGSASWIRLAARLAPGSDAGSAEDLGIGLAYALPRNPAAVLAVMSLDPENVIGAHRVCGVPFIEMPKPETDAYMQRADTAIGAVSVVALRSRRDACLAALRP